MEEEAPAEGGGACQVEECWGATRQPLKSICHATGWKLEAQWGTQG